MCGQTKAGKEGEAGRNMQGPAGGEQLWWSRQRRRRKSWRGREIGAGIPRRVTADGDAGAARHDAPGRLGAGAYGTVAIAPTAPRAGFSSLESQTAWCTVHGASPAPVFLLFCLPSFCMPTGLRCYVQVSDSPVHYGRIAYMQ